MSEEKRASSRKKTKHITFESPSPPPAPPPARGRKRYRDGLTKQERYMERQRENPALYDE